MNKIKHNTSAKMMKAAIRNEIAERISRMSEEEKERESYEVCKKIIQLLEKEKFQTLVSYTSFPDEVDTQDIHLWCQKNKKNLFLIPQSETEVLLPEESIIIVPGRAFSKTWIRLGRGSGFYDKLLQKNTYLLSLGLAFRCQIRDTLPQDSWDQRVDKVVFE